MTYSKPIETPPLCDACQTPMKLVPAGVSKKSGKAYGAFWSCPNNRECGGKTMPYARPTAIMPANPFNAEVLYLLKEIKTILETISDNLSGKMTSTIMKSEIGKDFPGKELQPDDFIPVLEEEEPQE